MILNHCNITLKRAFFIQCKASCKFRKGDFPGQTCLASESSSASSKNEKVGKISQNICRPSHIEQMLPRNSAATRNCSCSIQTVDVSIKEGKSKGKEEILLLFLRRARGKLGRASRKTHGKALGLLPRFPPIPETRGFCDIFNPRNPGIFFQ